MGATDADYELVYRAAIVPVIGEFAPAVVLVSAGFDAHERGSARLDARHDRRIRVGGAPACEGRAERIRSRS